MRSDAFGLIDSRYYGGKRLPDQPTQTGVPHASGAHERSSQ
jgi:hypothetical protein